MCRVNGIFSIRSSFPNYTFVLANPKRTTTSMIKYLFLLVAVCLAICSGGQTTTYNTNYGLTIEPNMKDMVEKYVTPSEFGIGQGKILIYNNRMLLDIYEDDKLRNTYKQQDNKSSVFKSFYYWKGDTLGIDGAFGLFGGTGFSIQLVNNRATLYHMVASDEYPSYAYKQKDSLIPRLQVPCVDTRIALSEIPDSTKSQVVYGYVEFKSVDYFVSSGHADGQEILPRRKRRVNMRIYFKCARIDM